MDNQQLVQSVVTAHQLLETLAQNPEGSSLTELSRELGMTPSRVLRHLATLVELQLVERDDGEPVYRLGVGLMRLAERAERQHNVIRLSYPALRQLSDRFGQATYLARRQGAQALVWISLESEGAPHITMPPGMPCSLTGSACGRVLLAFDPEAKVREPLKLKAGEGYPDPIPTKAALEERLQRIRTTFYDQHGTDGSNAIFTLAAPILDHRDRAVAVMAVAGFSVFFPHQSEILLEALLETAEELSKELGSRCEWPARTPGAVHSRTGTS